VKVRPEAAVKGITPTQPAPISQPRPTRTENVAVESSGGFFGFIKKIFSSSPAVEEKPAPSNNRGRNQGRNGNSGNGGDRNRGRNRRGERAERPAANATDGATAEGANNNRNGNRNNRNGNRNQNGPKPEREANTVAVAPVTEAAGSEVTPGTEGDERRGRGRNRRGRGRGRNERGERTENGDASTTVPTTPSASPFAGPPVGMAGASASMPIQNLANSFGNKPVIQKQERSERAPRPPRQSNRPAQNTTPTAVAAPLALVAAATVEVITKPAPELPKVAFQALEETPLHSVVQSAGMIWVATDASKHAEAQNQIQAEPVAHNLGRTSKPAASLPDGPMVLVETGGQEKTV
jgi:ribonuclease E